MLSLEEKEYLKSVAPLRGKGTPILLGSQAARVVGSGGDFFQLRPYVLGDDLRKVAWRLSTRTDRLVIRESRHEGPMIWRRWVDPTESMHINSRKPHVDKVLEATQWVWLRHRDKWDNVKSWSWGVTPLVIISDFIWDEPQWLAFQQVRRQQQIKLVHIVLPEELSWTNPPEYIIDSETGIKSRIDQEPSHIYSKQHKYWNQVNINFKGLPYARYTVGKSDLTALEGTLWS